MGVCDEGALWGVADVGKREGGGESEDLGYVRVLRVRKLLYSYACCVILALLLDRPLMSYGRISSLGLVHMRYREHNMAHII